MSEQHSPDESSPQLSDALRGIERQLSQLSPSVNSSWQSQLMFAAGRQLGQQEFKRTRWRSLLGVASLAACLSALVTAGWLREARQAPSQLAGPRNSQQSAAQPSTSEEGVSQQAATQSMIDAEPMPQVQNLAAAESTPTVAVSRPGLPLERQLDHLLARHLPSASVVADADTPSDVALPISLPTLREFSAQLRESL